MQSHVSVKPRAKLTQSDAITIYKLKASASAIKVGRLHGVSEKAIRDIWRARTWANETWHLDRTRPEQIKRTCRLVGHKDIKQDSGRQAPENKEPVHDIGDFEAYLSTKDSQVIELLNSFCLANTGLRSRNDDVLSGCMAIPLDELLFKWEQEQCHDLAWTDPFGQDWPMLSRTLASKQPE